MVFETAGSTVSTVASLQECPGLQSASWEGEACVGSPRVLWRPPIAQRHAH